MRIATANVVAQVWVVAESGLPIKLRIGAVKYGMDVDGAIVFVRNLIAAVDEFRGSCNAP